MALLLLRPARPSAAGRSRRRAASARRLRDCGGDSSHTRTSPSRAVAAVSRPDPSTISGSDGSTAWASAVLGGLPVPPLPDADAARARAAAGSARARASTPSASPSQPGYSESSATSCTRPRSGQRATSARASDVLPDTAPAVDEDDRIRRGHADDRLEDVRGGERRAPRRPGRRYFLRARMTRLSARPATQTNGIATARNETMFGSNAQVVALADVGAERDGLAAAAAAAVAGLVRSAAEAGPGQGDGDDADAVDVLLLAVGAVDAEGRGLLAELECDVGHASTLPGAAVRLPRGVVGRLNPGAAAADAKAACRRRAPRRAVSRASPRRARTGRPRRRARPRRAATPRRRPTASSPASPAGRSFSARTPMSRTGRRRSTASNSSSAASPIRWPTAVGSGSVCERRDRREVGEAHLDRDRRRLPAVRAQARADPVGESAQLGAQHGGVVDVAVERLFVADALLDACGVDAARASRPRARCQMRSPIAGAERAIEHRREASRARRRRCGCRGLERLGGLRADPPQRADRTAARRNAAVSASATISSPSGLLIVEAIFATCFVAATPMLQVSPVSSRTRRRRVRAISPGTPPQPPRAAHVEERLVDRERLDERRHVVEDPHDLRGHLEVAVEVRQHDDRRRAQAQRLTDGHRRAHAEAAGLVRRARDDASGSSGAPMMIGLPRSDGSSSTSTDA